MDKDIRSNTGGRTDERTRKAWSDNWSGHDVEKVMEIFGYERVKRLLAEFTAVLPEKGRILEGGCGLGPWLVKLTELGYDMVGVDYDEVSVNKIKEYAPHIPVYAADVEDMPFEDNSFSAYMSLGVLEHFSEGPGKAAKEAFRVLEEGGLFLLMLPYLNFQRRIELPLRRIKRNRTVRKFLGKQEKDYYYEYWFKEREIRDFLSEAGFDIEKIAPVDHIFTFVSLSGLFRDRSTYDGENRLAVKVSDFFRKFFPWQTSSSYMVTARKSSHKQKGRIK
ncbi:MAG: methyltransferase domain-containing protein [Candidatus Omnitrophica bacterium]|nr:methyltransferase domain-containing protein [Candidatus Omnitrophota bacterium]